MATSIGTLKAYVGADVSGLQTGMARAKRATASATKDINRHIGTTRKSIISLNSLFAAGIFGTGAALIARRVAGGFVEVASSFERMKVQLDALTEGRGAQTLEEINQWALDMPVNTQEAVAAFVRMSAFGLDPNIEKMQILTDVASIFGDEVLGRVSRALGQMAALGKLSAEELNQLSEAGINARKYLKAAFGTTVEEFQKSGMAVEEAINAIWEGMAREFGGSAARMQKSWQGIINTTKSYIVEIQRLIAEAGAFDALKSVVDDLNSSLRSWLQVNKDIIKQKVPEYARQATEAIESMARALGKIVAIYDAIPGEVLTVAAGGLIGKILLGGTGGKIALTLIGIDQGLKSLSSTIESISGAGRTIGLLPDKELVEANKKGMQELWEVLLGIRDWDSGLLVSQINRVTEEFDEMHDGITTVTSDVEDFGYALNKVSSKVVKPKVDIDPIASDIQFLGDFINETLGQRLQDALNPPEPLELPEIAPPPDVEPIDPKSLLPYDADEMFSDLDVFFGVLEEKREEDLTKWKESQQTLVDLTQHTAELMQDNFSDLFFDFMTGELKTLEDYADAVFKSMARMLADFAAKAAVEGLFGSAGGGTGGGLFGTIAGGIAGVIGFGGGGGAGATSGIMSMVDETGFAYGFSRGGAFAGPPAAKHVVRMATGGVVSSPTYFPLANGTALMGEAGPEGVLPLKRTSSGKLGVEVADGGGKTVKNKYNVNINVAAPEGRLARESLSQIHSTVYSIMRRNAERNN